MPRRRLPVSRPFFVVLALAVGVAVAVLAVAAWRQVRAAELPTGPAEWIWRDIGQDVHGQAVGPTAFYAVRDFRIGAADGALPPVARLLALGDEEYVLYLNGFRIGSNRYRPGAPLDVYRVEDLLLPGPNRLVAELRSSRGAGGFLAALEVEDGNGGIARPVVTDASWSVVPRHRPGLLEGWLEVDWTAGEEGEAGEDEKPGAPRSFEAPVSWGRPPTGRWDYPRRGDVRPVAARAGDPCHEVVAVSQGGDAPQRVVFDFGREVTGYLAVDHPPTLAGDRRVEAALFATGERPPLPLRNPRSAVPLLPVPGSPLWTDVVPRRFRYAAVVGVEGPVSAAVLPVAPEALELLPGAADGEAAAPGLLGVNPRGRRTPAEDAVRRRLREAEEASTEPPRR